MDVTSTAERITGQATGGGRSRASVRPRPARPHVHAFADDGATLLSDQMGIKNSVVCTVLKVPDEKLILLEK